MSKLQITQGDLTYLLDEKTKTASIINNQNSSANIIVPCSITNNSKEYIITTISDGAFENSSIKTITFASDSKLQVIGKNSFKSCNLESITIPSSVTKICNGAFFNCNHINQFIIPDDSKLNVIEDHAFENSSIKISFISSNVKSIKKDAYYACESIDQVIFSVNSKIERIPEGSFYLSQIKKVSIPSSVKSIENYAFSRCMHLKTISIPIDSKLEIIGESAFDNTAIESIYIPSNVKRIEYSAFSNTYALKKVTFAENSKLKIICKFAFSESGIESIIIPSSVKTINYNAFYQCHSLKEVLFQENSNLTQIEESVFSNTEIKKIIIPSNVTQIGKQAFAYNNSIQEITFSNDSKLKIIDQYAFANSSIEKIVVPSSVVEIGKGWINSTPKLNKIEFMPNNNKYCSYRNGKIIAGKSNNSKTFDVLMFCAIDLKYAIIPDEIKTIDECSFKDCKQLKYIEFSNNSKVNKIEKYAFSESSIEKIKFPSSLSCICDHAFYNCSELAQIIFEDNSNLQIIGDFSFAYSSIRSVRIPPKVSKFGTKPFFGCKNLQIFEFDKKSKMHSIGKEMFYGCIKAIIMIPVEISHLKLLNHPNLKDKYEKNFTFIVDGKRYETNRVVVDILSPIIRNYHYQDESITEFEIKTSKSNQTNFKHSAKEPDYFLDFLNLVTLENFEIDFSHQKYYLQYLQQLGCSLDFIKTDSTFTKELTIDNSVKSLKTIQFFSSEISQNKNGLYIQIIEYIALNFDEISKEELKTLDMRTIEDIFRNEHFVIQSEDSLLKFVLDLYKQDRSNSPLFEYILFNYTSDETRKDFLETFSIDSVEDEKILPDLLFYNRYHEDMTRMVKQKKYDENEEFDDEEKKQNFCKMKFYYIIYKCCRKYIFLIFKFEIKNEIFL